MSRNTVKKEDANDLLRERAKLSLLFDFYSDMLDAHKREIFGEYIMNDISLTEISEDEGISRQGVYDIIKRTSKQLHEYEEKLGLAAKYKELTAIADEFEKLGKSLKNKGLEPEQKTAVNLAKRLRTVI